MSHQEIRELLGAYALDAVSPEEAEAVDDHLRECPRCRAEAHMHRDTAALLVDGHLEPPPALWDRVASALDDTAPPIDLTQYTPRRARAGWRAAPRWIAAAAAVAAVLALGVTTLQQHREVDRVQAALEDQNLALEALAAFSDPSARAATLRSGDGALPLRAAVFPDGTGYLLADRLPALPDDRTYQLWAMVDGTPVSAGVLGSDPAVARFQAAPTTSALAISEEVAGGAEQPTLPARLTGLLEG